MTEANDADRMRHLKKEVEALSPEDRIRAIMAKPFWDYEEAALVLNLDVKTLRNMKWKRELSYTSFGRKVYLVRDQILQEMRQNQVRCPASAARARGQAGGGVA